MKCVEMRGGLVCMSSFNSFGGSNCMVCSDKPTQAVLASAGPESMIEALPIREDAPDYNNKHVQLKVHHYSPSVCISHNLPDLSLADSITLG